MKSTNAYAVIGAQFGDEGKGGMTDYLSFVNPEAQVVRFNGGAQAGHTVETGSMRHVFGHIGSGYFRSAPTWLSDDFICNPLLYTKEAAQLTALFAAHPVNLTRNITTPGATPDMPGLSLDIHPQCRITTFYDMLINQSLETARGQTAGAHGSCGVGINETVRRSETSNKKVHLYFKHLSTKEKIGSILQSIESTWVPKRLESFEAQVPGLTAMYEARLNNLDINQVRNNYINCAYDFYHMNQMTSVPSVFETARSLGISPTLIFEGAQGLRLDEELGVFPHLTPSKTGLPFIIKHAKKLGIEEIDVFYMTRAYTTRHGLGPLSHETPGKPYEGIVDKTNLPNTYQGALRFGYLDLDELGDIIRRDLARATSAVVVRPHIVMTCCDQVKTVRYRHKGEWHEGDMEKLLNDTASLGMPLMWNSSPEYAPRLWRPQTGLKMTKS